MKYILKYIAYMFSYDVLERIIGYSVIRKAFPDLNNKKTFSSREKLWVSFIDDFKLKDEQICFIEFGVYEGTSLDFFTKINTNPNSIFLGLDSFEGLPENWVDLKKGTFSTDGKLPDLYDKRVYFLKGWFYDTIQKLFNKIKSKKNIIVHYDADLYSSTLFCLSKMDQLKQDYFAIFDEFTGGESTALFHYMRSYGARVEFISKTNLSGFPIQVLCKVMPRKTKA